MNAIEVEQVSKRYWKLQERSLLRFLRPFGRTKRTELLALRDISFHVERGETIGMIGRNGAGKSTMLRLLAGVSQPSSGSVTTHGRVVPLLSVGVGFHREMTGRENVYVNGMLLGLSRAEMAARFDDIVDFAELHEFIDTPVKFYSSGMYMRLGFSVAIHVDPDILLVDEVLAVGDTGFQLRCFERMRALQQSGTTIVFVSHAMHAIHVLCPRVVVLQKGEVAFDGATEIGIARYHDLMSETDEMTGGVLRVVYRELLADDEPVESVAQGQLLVYRATLRFQAQVEAPQMMFHVLAEDGTLVYGLITKFGDRWRSYGPGDEATVEVAFHARFGGGGTYRISLHVTDDDGAVVLGADMNGPTFYVPPQLGVVGPADLGASIVVDGVERSDHGSLRFEGPAVGESRHALPRELERRSNEA